MPPRNIKSFYDIPGFFWWLDRRLFAAVLETQADSEPGVLVELGAYKGRSSVIVADALREGERFVVVDLFGSDDGLGDSEQDAANKTENKTYYKTLSRTEFEDNYLALHRELPEIIQGPSSTIMGAVEPDSVRFIHIDASHLYHFVREDVRNTKTLLRPGGIAVFDDYRSEHTPGVSAAVWEAVFTQGLIPIAFSPQKLYAVYEEDAISGYQDAIAKLIRSDRRLWMEEQEVLGRTVLRLNMAEPGKPAAGITAKDMDLIADAVVAKLERRQTTPKPAKKASSPKASSATKTNSVASNAAKKPKPKPTRSLSAPRRVVRKVARDVAPPGLTRAVVKWRDRKRAWDSAN